MFCLSAEEKKCSYFLPLVTSPLSTPKIWDLSQYFVLIYILHSRLLVMQVLLARLGLSGHLYSPLYFYYALSNTSANTETLVVLPCRKGVIWRLWACVNVASDFMQTFLFRCCKAYDKMNHPDHWIQSLFVKEKEMEIYMP